MATLLDIIFTNKCHLSGKSLPRAEGDLWRDEVKYQVDAIPK